MGEKSLDERIEQRFGGKNGFRKETKETNRIRKVIAVASGKGGVGKSMVTSLLAIALNNKGYRVGILDADVTGPSIPMTFGAHTYATSDGEGINPIESRKGIKMMSLNFLIENETDPVVWRGPVINGIVQQFWTDVYWGELDYLLIDLPPGTSDVVLTVYQSLPVDAVIFVSTPQDLVGMIVEKAIKMSEMVNIPTLALVENMQYIICPHCNEKIEIFGESKASEIADRYGIPYVVSLPIDPALTQAVDRGTLEFSEVKEILPLAEAVESLE